MAIPRIHCGPDAFKPRTSGSYGGSLGCRDCILLPDIRETDKGGGRIFIQGDGGADVVIGGNKSVSDGKWHFMTYIFKRDSNAQIYVDGVFDNQGAISQWNGKDFQSNNPFRIGAYTAADNVGVSPPLFNGLMDEVRVYNRALSASEISDLYRLGTRKFQPTQ